MAVPKVNRGTVHEWPDDFRDQIVALWNDGLSAGEIAGRFNLSRSAVIGKMHRLRDAGWQIRTSGPKVRKVNREWARPKIAFSSAPKPKPEPKPKAEVKPFILFAPAGVGGDVTERTKRRRELANDFMTRLEARMTGNGITIMQFGPGKCGNVTGGARPEWLFCGVTTDPGERFCPACRPRMYSKYQQQVAAE